MEKERMTLKNKQNMPFLGGKQCFLFFNKERKTKKGKKKNKKQRKETNKEG